jgi:ribonuclease HI
VGKGEGMSNNVAEYAAVSRVFNYISSRPAAHVIIHGDSNLVINQLNGKWGVHEGLYREVALEAQQMLEHWRSLGWEVDLQWIPRVQNEECDALSKGPLAGDGVMQAIQPSSIPI